MRGFVANIIVCVLAEALLIMSFWGNFSPKIITPLFLCLLAVALFSGNGRGKSKPSTAVTIMNIVLIVLLFFFSKESDIIKAVCLIILPVMFYMDYLNRKKTAGK